MSLLTRARIARLSGFATTQLVVQGLGFVAGILLVRQLDHVQYGFYTLAVSMVSVATILADLGLATAVLSVGGQLGTARAALGGLVGEAMRMHRRLLAWASLALVPCCIGLLVNAHASVWQAAALTLIVLGTAACSAPVGICLSMARLLGRTRLQQALDLGTNAARLALLAMASAVFLDATLACAIGLAVASAYALGLRRALALAPPAEAAAPSAHTPALRAQLARLAPNSLYYIVSSQLALWLIGIFGSAEKVAQVGALSRLGAVFVLIGSVSAALLFPYFARRHERAELASAFVGVNLFYGCLFGALLAMAAAFPNALLWILGANYAMLGNELLWMVSSATLAAWSGTVYSIGCARGWVMPVSLVGSVGMAATLAAAALVDVSTVRGSFMINTASGAAATVAAIVYFSWQLQKHARPRVALP